MKMKDNLVLLISVIFIMLVSMAMTGCVTPGVTLPTQIDYALIAKSYTEEKGQHDEGNQKRQAGYSP